MITALLWLTVSTPFVYDASQAMKQEAREKGDNCTDNNPFANSTEERSESSVNTLSEYLHEIHLIEPNTTTITKYYKCHPSDLYFEFHPELISPPPEV
jgi:hypothetical protein